MQDIFVCQTIFLFIFNLVCKNMMFRGRVEPHGRGTVKFGREKVFRLHVFWKTQMQWCYNLHASILTYCSFFIIFTAAPGQLFEVGLYVEDLQCWTAMSGLWNDYEIILVKEGQKNSHSQICLLLLRRAMWAIINMFIHCIVADNISITSRDSMLSIHSFKYI